MYIKIYQYVIYIYTCVLVFFRACYNKKQTLKTRQIRRLESVLRLGSQASILSEYLKDFAAEQEHHIRYRTEVLKVAWLQKRPNGMKETRWGCMFLHGL